MAIDIQNTTEMAKLGKAIQYSWSEAASERCTRNSLIKMYRDQRPAWENSLSSFRQGGAMVNLFQQYVRGMQIALAYRSPKYTIKARKAEGTGFDAMMESFLNQYTCVLNFQELLRQFAEDVCFGDAVAKTVESIAPKGIYSELAPRTFRVNPNNFIRDRSAEGFADCLFFADVYLVSLKEAQAYPGFNPEVSATLRPYSFGGDDSRSYNGSNNNDAYAEEVARLVDIYLPATGQICTYPAPNDSFGLVGSGELEVRSTPVNPYSLCRLTTLPDSVEEMSRLESLKELFLLTNDMWSKAARQSRQSKRNPLDLIGNQNDMDTLMSSPDGEPVFVNEKTADLYVLPGADPSVLQMAAMSQQTFSQQAGNLEVALGLGAGAGTARQSNQILQQVTAATALDQSIFNEFLSDIAKKLCSIAFQSETFEYQYKYKVPGLKYSINLGWEPASKLPRIGVIDDYNFEVVPLSASFRTPQERLQQLTQATQLFAQMMAVASQGAPINMAAVSKSIAEGFDLIPDLKEWWTPAPPQSPIQKTQGVYQSLAGPAQGSEVNYNGVGNGGQSAAAQAPQSPGGLQGGFQSGG